MLTLHVRDHDGARSRVWTDVMRAYGQFNIIDRQELQKFILIGSELGILKAQMHYCDGMDDDCGCPFDVKLR